MGPNTRRTVREGRVRATLGVAVLVVAVALGACGGDDGAKVRTIGDGTGTGTGTGTATGTATGTGTGTGTARCEPVGDIAEADTVVNVTLDEWVIKADRTSVRAGKIGFVAENVGERAHELAIIRGEPNTLPIRDGVLDEDALPEGAFIGEIEAFPPKETCEGVFDLSPGVYTLACLIVETHEGKEENHLAEGMLTTLTVE